MHDTEHPNQTNGRVDVSVLVPVLNEERHIRESVAAMLGQHYEGEIEFLFMDGRSEDAHEGDPRGDVGGRPPHPCAGQPAAARPRSASTSASRTRAATTSCGWTRTPSIRPSTSPRASSACSATTGSSGSPGPQIPHGIGPWSRRVAIALTSWLGAGGSSEVGGRGGEGHRHRRLHGRLEALDARRVRRMGRRLARQPGLRAGGAVLRARLPDRLHARAGRAVRAARLAEEARQAVLALRLLPREDQPLPPEQHAPLGDLPARPRAGRAGRGDRAAPDPARRAGRARRLGRRGARHERARRACALCA